MVVVIGVGAYFLYPQPMTEPTDQASDTLVSPLPTPIPAFTLAQVAEHPDKNSCWLALEGKVYDVTPFVASGLHPGKEAILQGCGKDATELFNNRPNESGAHSERARSMLPKYLIGELAQ